MFKLLMLIFKAVCEITMTCCETAHGTGMHYHSKTSIRTLEFKACVSFSHKRPAPVTGTCYPKRQR